MEPKAPQTCGAEAPTARSGFFTSRALAPAWRSRAGTLAWTLAAASLALLLAAQRTWARLDDALAPNNVDRVARVTLRVVQLPQLAPNSRRFRAQVLSSTPAGVPRDIVVSWFAPDRHDPFTPPTPWPFPDIVPGQVWRMALNLRPVAGERNPHGFDAEGHWFALGIRATGSVRGSPVWLRDDPWIGLGVAGERLRQRVRAAMQPYVQDLRYGAVLTALAIGDQAGVATADWQVFNRSGMTHLVSISGSHITMLAVLGGLGARWAWKRLRWRRRWMAERIPAPLVGAWAALAVAWGYCLLAGWGVPARRTFVMLAVLALAYTARLPLTPSRILLLAACAVVLFDPWALMASGFWLSFAAVAVLMASQAWGSAKPAAAAALPAPKASPWAAPWTRRRLAQTLWGAARLQLAITLALMPLLARLFHEISLVSPLTNAYAIPVVGLLVTPLALLLATLACIPGLQWLAQAVAWLAHGILKGIMQPTQWLAAFPAASIPVAAVPWALTLLAVAGMACAMLPGTALDGRNATRALARCFALRHLGWLLVLPALLWQPDKPALGDWTLTVLDTGQSGAALLQTRTHAFLFDTGKRTSPDVESGSRTIAPFLRSQGIRALDAMIVSHTDLDHAGGASGVLRALPVHQSFSAFDLPAWLRREAQRLGTPDDVAPLPQEHHACTAGQHWEVDGVSFRFLWPPAAPTAGNTQGASEQVERQAGATVRDGLQGANRSDSRSYREDLQHSRPPESVDACGVVTCSEAPQTSNAASCVLLVRGAHHAILFTGDIGAAQEHALLANAPKGMAAADVVLAPHHGSRFSSSDALIAATRPAHVIAQAGLWNPFGHPHAQTVRRWRQAGATVWRTDLDGAVQVRSQHGALTADSTRERWPHYWQLPCTVRQACRAPPVP